MKISVKDIARYFILVIIAVVLIVVASEFKKRSEGKTLKNEISEKTVVRHIDEDEEFQNIINEILSEIEDGGGYKLDTDGDGLEDWEEEVWGTNPFEKDTDGDGISDMEEVEEYRSELVDGVPEEVINLVKEELNGDETSKIAIDIYGSLAYLGAGNGESTDTTEIKSGYEKKIANLYKKHYKKYKKSDIRTIYAPSENKIMEYLGASIAIMDGAYSEIFPDKLTVALASEEYKTELENIRGAIIYYGENLKAMTVPEAVADEHLEVLSSLSALSSAIEFMIDPEKDPLVALSFFGAIDKILLNLQKSFSDFASRAKDEYESMILTGA